MYPNKDKENPQNNKPPFKQNPFLLFIIFAVITMMIVRFASVDSGDGFLNTGL